MFDSCPSTERHDMAIHKLDVDCNLIDLQVLVGGRKINWSLKYPKNWKCYIIPISWSKNDFIISDDNNDNIVLLKKMGVIWHVWLLEKIFIYTTTISLWILYILHSGFWSCRITFPIRVTTLLHRHVENRLTCLLLQVTQRTRSWQYIRDHYDMTHYV